MLHAKWDADYRDAEEGTCYQVYNCHFPPAAEYPYQVHYRGYASGLPGAVHEHAPKGHAEKVPSLNSCIPKGMPTTVMHIRSPIT